MVATIRIDDKELRTFLKILPKKLENGIEKGIQDWGVNHQENMRLASAHAGFWSGETYRNIKWRKRKLGGFLEMPLEGIYLDKAKPHWVKLARGREITEWALSKGIAVKKKYGVVETTSEEGPPRSIRVFGPKSKARQKRGWINRTTEKDIPKLDKFLQREVDKIK